MKVISLWQPWATLVACGAKRVETRHWGTKYTGPIAIHATRHAPPEAVDLIDERPFREVLAVAMGRERFTMDDFPRGSILAICRLDRCARMTEHSIAELYRRSPSEYAFGHYAPGRYAWVLKDRHELPTPINVLGRQGLWTLPDEAWERLRTFVPDSLQPEQGALL